MANGVRVVSRWHVPDTSLSPRSSPVRSRRLCRLNHHGWREKPGRLDASGLAKRSSACRGPGRAACTRRGAAYLALHAPRRTFEKRPCRIVYFSNFVACGPRTVFKRGESGSPVRVAFPSALSLRPGGSFRRDYSILGDPPRISESIFARESRERNFRCGRPLELMQAKASFPFAVCCLPIAATDDCHPCTRASERAATGLFLLYLRSSAVNIHRSCNRIYSDLTLIDESRDSASDGLTGEARESRIRTPDSFFSRSRRVRRAIKAYPNELA